MAASKRTPQQQLEAVRLAKKKLEEKEKQILAKMSNLTSASPGMQAVLDAVESAATQNNVKVPEIVRAVAKLKRTGLKIDKAERKPRTPKDPNAPKKPRASKKLKKALPP